MFKTPPADNTWTKYYKPGCGLSYKAVCSGNKADMPSGKLLFAVNLMKIAQVKFVYFYV